MSIITLINEWMNVEGMNEHCIIKIHNIKLEEKERVYRTIKLNWAYLQEE